PYQAGHPNWQPALEPAVGQDGGAEHDRIEDELVRHLRVDSATGLAQRPFVYVLDRKGQVRVDRMVFAVDDVTDSADRKAKRVRRAGGVEEQPVVDLALPAPEEGPDQPAENAAPLAKAAFVDKDDLLPCAAELPVVLPHVEQARPDQAGDHHPDRQV